MTIETSPLVSLNLLNFPQQLLIGKKNYLLNFEITNLVATKEDCVITFTGAHCKILNVSSNSIKFSLNPSEKKSFNLEITPTHNGAINLNFEVIHQKKEEYQEIFWEVKKKIEKTLIQTIINEKPIENFDIDAFISKIPTSIELNGIETVTSEQAHHILNEIQSPPKAPPPRKIIRSIEKVIPSNSKEEDQHPSEIETKIIHESVIEYVQDPAPPSLTIEEKDSLYSDLVIKVAQHDIECALETIKLISKEDIRKSLYKQIVPLGYSQNYSFILKEVLTIPFTDLKNHFLSEMAYFRIKTDPNESAMVLLNISDDNMRDSVLSHIIFYISTTQPSLASKLVYQFSTPELQHKILFALIKIWSEKNRQIAISSLKSLIETILTKTNTELIRSCMILLAHLTNPLAVVELIENMKVEEDKIWLKNLLKKDLKEKSKRTTVRMIPQIVQTLFYSFPCATTNITSSLDYLSKIGGNLSINLLDNVQSPQVIFLCPFKHNFSLYSSIQQVYFSVESEIKKSFGFILFPEDDLLAESNWVHLKDLLGKFVIQNPNPTHLILLDFIPYMSKPSVFYSSNEINQNSSIYTKLYSIQQYGINLFHNTHFFHEGEILNKIQSQISNSNLKFINMVLTYNFLRDLPFLNLFFKTIVQ
ncbi:hypothetical protein [Candidatus Lokiarchaeum ossiferum]|uniref:hypothetical protein n=1 Tax=Candidatus Lokiarchaeum ossiferum TaxID=2951803 RepID=UPI00352F3FF5